MFSLWLHFNFRERLIKINICESLFCSNINQLRRDSYLEKISFQRKAFRLSWHARVILLLPLTSSNSIWHCEWLSPKSKWKSLTCRLETINSFTGFMWMSAKNTLQGGNTKTWIFNRIACGKCTKQKYETHDSNAFEMIITEVKVFRFLV